MAKITDIKYKIDQLDGGTFQNLCDAYLACLGYRNIYSLGMKEGTSKTAIGNPDTYFLNADGDYIFVMYTTQKTNVFEKALDDIKKCLDASLTGIVEENVAEIIFCHTCGRLSPGQDKKLRDYCISRNTALTLKGIDEIATDLYLKYGRVAKDFLGVSTDSGQIMKPEEFVSSCDENKMSAPLNVPFILRTIEKEALLTKLQDNDVVILTGAAGVGKSRLALEACSDFAEKNDCEFFCVRSKQLEIYEDVEDKFHSGGKFLFLIDDANELSGLHHILTHVNQNNKATSLKILITVRDYAKRSVIQTVLEFSRFTDMKLSPFKDDEIRELVKEHYGITNNLYGDRIVAIAEGNARLAMLAGRIAAESNDLNSIRDASELYNNYYEKQIESILSGSSTELISAGIIAFLQAIRIDQIDYLHAIFQMLDVSGAQFIADLKQLHNLELVDICNDKAVRISDQSFGNFLIKYVFVDRKSISLSAMINTCFFVNKIRTVAACNVLFGVFFDEGVHSFVEQEINDVWEKLKPDQNKFIEFLKSFHMLRPTETLLALQQSIEDTELVDFDSRLLDFEKESRGQGVSDETIMLLHSFSLHTQLPEALELLLQYYKKCPDLFMEIYFAFTGALGVDKDSARFDYFTQVRVVEHLDRVIKTDPSDNNLLLFIRVAKDYLKLFFTPTEGGRNHTFVMYRIPLTSSMVVAKYRHIIWKDLIQIYRTKKFTSEIEDILLTYGNDYNDGIDYRIVEEELDDILNFFREEFSEENLLHCILANQIKNVIKRADIAMPDVLDLFLNSHKFITYRLLSEIFYDRDLSYEEFEALRRREIENLVRNYTLDDMKALFQIYKEISALPNHKSYSTATSLEFVFQTVSLNKKLFVETIQLYLQQNTPGNVRPELLLDILFGCISCDDVYSLIQKEDFRQKNAWIWSFYTRLPEENINLAHRDQLLAFLEKPPLDLGSSGYRPIDALRKYEIVDENIIVTASKIILTHYDESPFVFHLYFDLMLNPHHETFHNVIALYKNEFNLLCEIYLKLVAYTKNADYHGNVLMKLVTFDSKILCKYLQQIITSKSGGYLSSSDTAVERLKTVWRQPNYIELLDEIVAHFMETQKSRKLRLPNLLKAILVHKENDTETALRQDSWVKLMIEKYCKDDEMMYIIFSAISESAAERRIAAIKQFVNLNPSPETFDKLPIEASRWGGTGSMIPYMQRRIDFLTSLMSLFSGIKYLKHKQRITNDIQRWKSMIEQEEIDELLERY